MAWQYIEYKYPISHTFEKMLAWVDSSCRIYFATRREGNEE